MYKFIFYYLVYCTSCKQTSITGTDAVKIEINNKVNNFQDGIDNYCAAESLYPYEFLAMFDITTVSFLSEDFQHI